MTGKQAKIVKVAVRRHHAGRPHRTAPEWRDFHVRNEALYRELWQGQPAGARRFDVILAIIAGDQTHDEGALHDQANRMHFRSSYGGPATMSDNQQP